MIVRMGDATDVASPLLVPPAINLPPGDFVQPSAPFTSPVVGLPSIDPLAAAISFQQVIDPPQAAYGIPLGSGAPVPAPLPQPMVAPDVTFPQAGPNVPAIAVAALPPMPGPSAAFPPAAPAVATIDLNPTPAGLPPSLPEAWHDVEKASAPITPAGAVSVKVEADNWMWIAGGLTALAAVGGFLYLKKSQRKK